MDDAVFRLAETLAALDVHMADVGRSQQRLETNRSSIIHVHAVVALLAGPLFSLSHPAAFVGAAWEIIRMVPWFPDVLGWPFALAGAVVAWGSVVGSPRLTAWGLGGMLAWYATVGIASAVAVMDWVLAPAERGPVPPLLHFPLIYMHLAAIMGVHVWTLLRLRADRRRP
jgi:hypothetical protein